MNVDSAIGVDSERHVLRPRNFEQRLTGTNVPGVACELSYDGELAWRQIHRLTVDYGFVAVDIDLDRTDLED